MAELQQATPIKFFMSASSQTGFAAEHTPVFLEPAFTEACLEAQWFAAYTSARHEKRVVLQMEGHGVHCFLPLYKSVRRWKDRRKELELPLFPGYVFVRIAMQDRLQVLRLPGVVQLVRSSGQPVALPDAEIDALRCGLAGNVCVQPHPFLKVGRRVRVHSGPMTGMEGILVRKKDKFRVVLSIELIQRSVAMEVDETDIEPAG